MAIKLKLNCEYCNKEIVRYQSEVRNRVFCSHKCHAKTMLGKHKRQVRNRMLVSCSYCSTPVYRWRFELRQDKRHFCNKECFGKWRTLHLVAEKACNWKGGSYSTIANTLCNSRYRRIRKIVLGLDNNKCQLCPSSHRLEVHHIIEKGKNPALIYDITNMVTLCKKCHSDIRGKEEDYAGLFDGIIANRMNSGNPRTGNPEPSAQSAKVQRLLESSDTLNNQLELPARK